jgi:hypothetical protein
MRDYIRTNKVSIPIPTEPELYLIMAVIILFVMMVVLDG